MALNVQTRLIVRKPLQCPLGRIPLAGFIRESAGVPDKPMRIFDSYAAVYLLEGGGWYRDSNGRRLNVGAGDLIWVFPDVAHAYGPKPGQFWNEIYVVFDGPVFDLWRKRQLLNPDRPVLRLEPVEYWLPRLQSCVEEADGGEPHPLEAVCRLQRVLAEVLVRQERQSLGREEEKWLARASALLDSVDGEQSMEQVAERLGVSYVHFRKRFTKLAGVPPAKYRFGRTVERACRMLQERSTTVRGVAEACGFCNEFHFSRRFKQAVGLSPSDFRRRIRGRADAKNV